MIRLLAPLVLILALPGFAAAATPASPTLFGFNLGAFWAGFRNYWVNLFGSANGAVVLAVGLGALGLFVITRGKRIK